MCTAHTPAEKLQLNVCRISRKSKCNHLIKWLCFHKKTNPLRQMAPKMTLTGKLKGIAEEPSAKQTAQGLAAWSNWNAWDSKILIWAEEMVESSVCVTVCRQGHLSGSSLAMCQNNCSSRYSKIKWFWIKIKKHPKYQSSLKKTGTNMDVLDSELRDRPARLLPRAQGDPKPLLEKPRRPG